MATCKNCFHCKVGCAYMASDCDTEEVLELCAKGKQDEIPNIEDLCEDFVDKDNVFIPPVKVGQTVFLVKNLIIIKTTVEKLVMKQNGLYMKLSCNISYETSCNSIGKTIFLDLKDAQEQVKTNSSIIEVYCENCGHYEEKQAGVSKTNFIKEMRKKGWRIGEATFCPECAPMVKGQRGV